MKKRFISCLIIMALMVSVFQINAFAMEQSYSAVENGIEIVDGVPCISVDSQEEYDLVVKQIMENNQKVEKLWTKALEESEKLPYRNVTNMPKASNKYYSESIPVSIRLTLTKKFEGYHALRGHVTTNSSPTFVDYTYVNVVGQESDFGTIFDLTHDVKPLDSYRTYAVHSSFYIKLRLSGDADTFPVELYSEFYAGGGGMNYN